MSSVDLELPASEWRAIDARSDIPAPATMLFVDGVRRIEARVWIDSPGATGEGASGPATDATAALCASYAAGVVCCCGQQAHLVTAELRRGLFSIAPHASDISTRAGKYQAHHVAGRAAGVPLMARLSQALQRRLADVEVVAAAAARSAIHDHGTPVDDDLLIIDGPLRGRQHLPRALGYIKSHLSHLPATRAQRARRQADAWPAHPGLPNGDQLGKAQLVPAASRPVPDRRGRGSCASNALRTCRSPKRSGSRT